MCTKMGFLNPLEPPVIYPLFVCGNFQQKGKAGNEQSVSELEYSTFRLFFSVTLTCESTPEWNRERKGIKRQQETFF